MGCGEVSANAGANAARIAIRAERISFYVAMGGPEMPNARAAELLGVSVKTVNRYRAGLIAAGAVTRRPAGPAALQPCGTLAAVRRHYRRGEACAECRLAEARAGDGQAGTLTPDYREKRNNMPDVPLYQWRARVYPWAQRAIAAVEAVHGEPEPTCACGAPLEERRARNPGGRCETCDPAPPPPPASPPPVHFLGPSDEPACHVTGNTTSTTDPGKVTCLVCLRSRVLARARAGRMVSS
jgi:hypothetical protein